MIIYRCFQYTGPFTLLLLCYLFFDSLTIEVRLCQFWFQLRNICKTYSGHIVRFKFFVHLWLKLYNLHTIFVIWSKIGMFWSGIKHHKRSSTPWGCRPLAGISQSFQMSYHGINGLQNCRVSNSAHSGIEPWPPDE